MKESLHEGTFMKIKGCAKKPLKQRKQPLKESYVCLYKRIILIGHLFWFLRIKERVAKIMPSSVIH